MGWSSSPLEIIESVAKPDEREKTAFVSCARSASSSRFFTSADIPATPDLPLDTAGRGALAFGLRLVNLR